MRCSNCGREVSPFNTEQITRYELGGDRTARGDGATTHAVPAWLCPDCMKSREAVKRTLLRTMAGFFIGLLLLALVGGLFALWR